jgi:hypothetical protein
VHVSIARSAIAAAEHPELGRHFEVSVRTGTCCAYTPDRQVRWHLTM